MKAFRVLLNEKEIDKVFYSDSSTETAEDVKRSLINHDGYDPNIEVKQERNSKKSGRSL